MGSLRSAVLAVFLLAAGTTATLALGAGPGGWNHLGDGGTPGSDSLNLVASALEAAPGALYAGGEFTDAAGIPAADRIARWNGNGWSAVSSAGSQISNGRVSAIAVSGSRVFAGGTFQNAGGDADADFLAVWDGTSWAPFCEPHLPSPAFTGNVTSLQILGGTLYVGGEFVNGAGIATADSLVACALSDGASHSTVTGAALPFSGPVYALTADAAGNLYAGGGFSNLEDLPGADNVAFLPPGGTWQPMGTGGGTCDCAVTSFVRGLTAVGDDVYIGTDANDVAGLPAADHVARWDGSQWRALGARSGGNGWFPASASIQDLAGTGSILVATGSFQDAGGDARADNVAFFDGAAWHPVGSDGAGGGPWSGTGLALAVVDRQLYAAGSFTSAGGDPQAHSVASFSLAQIIAYPTPTVTPGPTAAPTPTVTPGPTAAPTPTVTPSPVDTAAPVTSLRATRIQQETRRATFRFGAGEPGAKFLCRLDKRRTKSCTSPKTYKRLKPGRHVFRVRARDAAGNVDATPKVKRFRIRKP